MARSRRRRDPSRLGALETVGAWLRIWTPHRDAVVPPPPWPKIALAALAVVVVSGIAVAVIAPAVDRAKSQRADIERKRTAAIEAARRKRLAEEGRPRHGQGERPVRRLSPAGRLLARRTLVHDLERAITRDARARVRAGELEGRVLATQCEINPPSRRRRIEGDPDARGSDYDCLAVTGRDREGRFTVGYSFDAAVDYRRFRFRWSKACLAPGEGAARLTC